MKIISAIKKTWTPPTGLPHPSIHPRSLTANCSVPSFRSIFILLIQFSISVGDADIKERYHTVLQRNTSARFETFSFLYHYYKCVHDHLASVAYWDVNDLLVASHVYHIIGQEYKSTATWSFWHSEFAYFMYIGTFFMLCIGENVLLYYMTFF